METENSNMFADNIKDYNKELEKEFNKYMAKHIKYGKYKKIEMDKWKNKSGKFVIVLNANEFGKWKKGYIVYSNVNSEFFYNVSGKTYKTKSKALKIAKDFMKKH